MRRLRSATAAGVELSQPTMLFERPYSYGAGIAIADLRRDRRRAALPDGQGRSRRGSPAHDPELVARPGAPGRRPPTLTVTVPGLRAGKAAVFAYNSGLTALDRERRLGSTLLAVSQSRGNPSDFSPAASGAGPQHQLLNTQAVCLEFSPSGH